MEGIYQQRDAHIIDYAMYSLGNRQGTFRGPPVTGLDYVACIGGAQTFGRFVEKPFPTLVAEGLGIEALNLGRGGGGPMFFLNQSGILDYANRARLVIVQVLSGRSQSNSLFDTGGSGMQGVNTATGAEMNAGQFFNWLLKQSDEGLKRRIVDETRDNYVAAMKQLLAAIKPPKVLLWISTRMPDYEEKLKLPVGQLFGAFPQLVNRAMVEELRGHADTYVECVSQRGWPQPLVDRSGKPTTVAVPAGEKVISENRYYPSPEMHEDAAALLVPACKDLLERGRKRNLEEKLQAH